MSDNPKIWGIGLGRTGTKSLVAALGELGYNIQHIPAHLSDLMNPELDGTAEGTTAFHFRYLDLRFPGSKFILTTRCLNDWLASCRRAIEDLYPAQRFDDGELNEWADVMVRNRSSRYGTIDYNRDALIETYFRHQYEVVTHFKNRPDDLLIIDITKGEGWPELCAFLGCEVPNTPFPLRAEP